MLLGGCFQPLFNDSQWDSTGDENSDSFWGSESDPEDELDEWGSDEWTDEDLEAWLDEEEAAESQTEFITSFEEDAYVDQHETAQDGDFPVGHDPECDQQFHGPE